MMIMQHELIYTPKKVALCCLSFKVTDAQREKKELQGNIPGCLITCF